MIDRDLGRADRVEPLLLVPGGTARVSAWMTPRPRCRARAPVSRSNSTSQVPAAAASASRAAALSGARPRVVWTRIPVALITGTREAAIGGSSATAASATRSGVISPFRARSWARVIAALTRSRPRRRCAAAMRGSASSWSVRGIFLRRALSGALRGAPAGARGG